MNKNNNYILMMAGGSGTRLFPRSTDDKPKQFQRILGELTLVEELYNRIKDIVPRNNIYISSNEKYINLIEEFLPEIDKKNYIIESCKRNTGPALALATTLIYKKNKDAIIFCMPADHFILNNEEYKKGILASISTIENHPNYILSIGIKPTSPHIGYGYIEKNEEFRIMDKYIIYNTKRFVEKPNLEKAKEYFGSQSFFWNGGYFVWQAEHFLNELKKYAPSVYKIAMKIANKEGSKNFKNIIEKEFEKMPNIAVDYMIIEKTKNLLVLPLDIGWSDIGSWDAVCNLLGEDKRDKDGNYVDGKAIYIDTHNTTIFSHDKNKIIATIGLDNFIIITTDKAIVVVPKGRSEDVKKIVEKLDKFKE